MHDVVGRFSILFPANLITKKENIIVKEAKLLQAKYSDDISPEFPMELLSFRTIENEIKTTTTVKQLANLYTRTLNLDCNFINIFGCLHISNYIFDVTSYSGICIKIFF